MPGKSLPEDESRVNTPNPSSRDQARSRFKLIPMSDDRLFAPDCDLLSIRYNTETKQYTLDSSTQETQYITGDCSLTIKRFPAIALRNIQRIQSRMGKKVGIHPLVSVCISYGLGKITSNKWIEQLLQAYNRHKMAPNTIPGIVDENIQSYLSRFDVDTPKGSLLIPRIHERTDGRLTNLSMQLGISKASLSSLAVCITIADQNDTIEDDIKEIGKFVDKFFESAWIRGTAAKALMDAFNVPEWKEGEAE